MMTLELQILLKNVIPNVLSTAITTVQILFTYTPSLFITKYVGLTNLS